MKHSFTTGNLVRFTNPEDQWETDARFDVLVVNGNRIGISSVEFRNHPDFPIRPIETISADQLEITS
jgi:hypothetical protein